MKITSYPIMHVSLYVSDIEQTIKFYTRFFRKEPNKIKSKYAKFVLDKPAVVISFVEDAAKVRQNFGHLGFLVETKDELLKHLQYIQKAGIPHLEEMQTSCCYALQDKFWVKDPDGIQWEVYCFHKDVEFNDPAYDLSDSNQSHPAESVPSTKGSACC